MSLKNLKFLLCCIAGALSALSLPAQAQDADSLQHEAPVWSGSYRGRLAGKEVQLELWRLDGAVGGSYCYEPCNRPGAAIDLTGAASGQLTETPMTGSNDPKPTGRWLLAALPGMAPARLQGQWQSMDGKRRWPVDLALKPPEFAHATRFELRLVLDQTVRSLADCGQLTDQLVVSAIHVYEQGRLKQKLPTEANGSCWFLQPKWVDANFDGWPDLTQELQLPAGPNIPTTTWLYDPVKKQFALGPPALQEITSPAFDAKAQRIYSEWRGSCCSHGVGVYAWQGGQLKMVESDESYVLPVRKSGKLMGCYIAPVYKDGHVFWPDALFRNADGLAMGRPAAADWCDLDVRESISQAQLKVLALQKSGEKPSVQAAYGMSYVTVNTPEGPRFCPDLMVFDADARKLVRLQLTENPIESCVTER